MSADWQQFLMSLGRLLERPTLAPNTNDLVIPGELELLLRQVAQDSVFADKIVPIVDALETVPGLTYVKIAAHLSQLLHSIEWPPALDEARSRMEQALGNMVHQFDVTRAGNLVYELRGSLCPPFFRWAAGFISTWNLLNSPCRLDELHEVANICNLSLQGCLEELRAALTETPSSQAILDARVSFLYAHAQYAEAARNMNEKVGGVLFLDYSPPLPS